MHDQGYAPLTPAPKKLHGRHATAICRLALILLLLPFHSSGAQTARLLIDLL
jgi:hypothetical protein